MIECPIHKVARNDIVSDIECKSCDFYNDCLFDMTDEMSAEMMGVVKKYLAEIQETVRGYTVKKVKESVNVET